MLQGCALPLQTGGDLAPPCSQATLPATLLLGTQPSLTARVAWGWTQCPSYTRPRVGPQPTEPSGHRGQPEFYEAACLGGSGSHGHSAAPARLCAASTQGQGCLSLLVGVPALSSQECEGVWVLRVPGGARLPGRASVPAPLFLSPASVLARGLTLQGGNQHFEMKSVSRLGLLHNLTKQVGTSCCPRECRACLGRGDLW